jgi:GNAT superfamily N-acetyltransferase
MAALVDISKIYTLPVKVYFLEMHESKPAPGTLPGTEFELLLKPITPAAYRKLYYGVGEKWHWLDRMVMADDELEEKINAANTDIFVFKVENETAGYIEFVKENQFTEIQYFGLMPAFIGKGFGSYFLEWVIAKAWSYQPQWIQLNTCTLDHPNALAVYTKAGFKPVRTEIQERKILIS